jgi:tetratricopeptide (TPR) repeat protein
MQYITLAEFLIRLALTIIVICIPLYQEIGTLIKKMRSWIKFTVRRLLAIRPEDLLWSSEIVETAPIENTVDAHVWPNQETDLIDVDEFMVSETTTLEIDSDGTKIASASRHVTAKINLTPQELALHDKLAFLKHSAKLKQDAGKIQEAEKALIEAQTLWIHDRDVDSMLAALYFDQGSWIKASSLIKKLLGDDADNHDLIWQLWFIHMQQQDLDTAKHLFQKCIKLKDDKPKYYVSLVDVHIMQESRYDAMFLLEKLHKLRPAKYRLYGKYCYGVWAVGRYWCCQWMVD